MKNTAISTVEFRTKEPLGMNLILKKVTFVACSKKHFELDYFESLVFSRILYFPEWSANFVIFLQPIDRFHDIFPWHIDEFHDFFFHIVGNMPSLSFQLIAKTRSFIFTYLFFSIQLLDKFFNSFLTTVQWISQYFPETDLHFFLPAIGWNFMLFSSSKFIKFNIIFSWLIGKFCCFILRLINKIQFFP